MNRVPEPELMTADAQVDAYAIADFSELHEPLVAWFAERFGDDVCGRMLDVGCGPGDIAIRFARRYPGVTILGVDGSAPMLARGREALAAAGLAGRVTLAQRLVPDSSLETGTFDAVVANSVLHHLSDPATLWRTVRLAARPGAPIMVADLLRPASVDAAHAIVARYAAEARPVLRQDFFNSLCASYTVDEIAQQIARSGIPGLQVDHLGDLHVVAWGRAE